MRFPDYFVAATTLFALTACSEIVDTHASGDGPMAIGAIPGPPDGDSVTAQGNVIFNGGSIQLVSGGNGPQTGVAFVTAGKPHNTSEYSIRFSGVKLSIEPLPVMAIDLFDTQGRAACGLEISSGEFRLVSGAGTQVIGGYSANADQHNVWMRLEKQQNRCYALIRQVPQGQPDQPETQPAIEANGPFADSAFSDLDQIRFVWEQQARGGTSYFIGPLVATRRN